MISGYGFAESNVAIEPYQRAARRQRARSACPICATWPRRRECGHWPTNLADDPRNLPYPNLGCAQQHNLAAQIANPADLLGPRTDGRRPTRSAAPWSWTSTARARRRAPRRASDERVQVKSN